MPWSRYIVLFAVLATAIGGTHTYLYRRLVRDVTEDPGARRLGRWLFLLLGLSLPAGIGLSRALPRDAGVIAGYWGPPMRVKVPPEISDIRIV